MAARTALIDPDDPMTFVTPLLGLLAAARAG